MMKQCSIQTRNKEADYSKDPKIWTIFLICCSLYNPSESLAMSMMGCPADDQRWNMAKLSKGLQREQKIIEVDTGLSPSLLIHLSGIVSFSFFPRS